MAQPKFSGVCTFGGAALPNGQGTMTSVNLMDGTNWVMLAIGDSQTLDYGNFQFGMAQFAYRGRGAFISSDVGPLTLPVTFLYREVNNPVGQALDALWSGGEQWLSFDGATQLLCRVGAVTNRAMLSTAPPLAWQFDISFIAKAGFFQDLTPTTLSPVALSSGTATTFNVTYAGGVWCDNAVWTLTIPNTNAAPIAGFVLANTTASQTLTVKLPAPLAASTAWTLTIDTGASTIKDQSGHHYDFTGSFPFLFPPSGQVNAMSATLTPASGTATGCTLGAVFTPRYLI